MRRIKSRIERLEARQPEDFDLEEWAIEMQTKENIIYNGGKPFTPLSAEEFIEQFEQECEEVTGHRANLFGGRYSKPQKKRRARHTSERNPVEEEGEVKNE